MEIGALSSTSLLRLRVPSSSSWRRIISARLSSDRISPVPWQWLQGAVDASSMPGRRRWRLISIRPKPEMRPTCIRARSVFSLSFNRFSTDALFLRSSISMKSMTISPARSRRRNWRATSSAASILVFSAVSSMEPSLVARPEFTSMATSASVMPITM